MNRRLENSAPLGHCVAAALVASVSLLMAPVAMAQATLKAIKDRGHLICGVNPGTPGFSYSNSTGKFHGLDVDYCRAIASAIFSDANKAKQVPLSPSVRFTALQAGEVDVLTRNSGFNVTRNTKMGLQGGPVNFYAGQAFMVKKSMGIKSAKELDNATLCAPQGSTIELNTADYARANNIKIKLLSFDSGDEAQKAYLSGRCDVYSSDNGSLAAIRSELPNPEDHELLPEVISREPNVAFTRQGDEQFSNIVKWVFYVTINSEDLGITSQNVDDIKRNTNNAEIKRMLGVEGDIGPMLGLDKDWAYNIIKQVGNYGESYERYFGSGSKLKLPRGLNSLWRNGGLMYSPPFI